MIMMTEKTKEVKSENIALLQGTIVHKFVTPSVAILTINTGNATPIPNYPKVLFFGSLKEKVEKEFKMHQHVTITGNVQSTKKKDNVKKQVLQSIFGETITETKSDIENAFGSESKGSHKPYVNKFKIAGTVMSIDCPTKNIVKFVVKTQTNGRYSFASYVCYTSDSKKLLSEIQPEDNVYAVGCIQTSKGKKSNGEIEFYQNYVINEIVKQ